MKPIKLSLIGKTILILKIALIIYFLITVIPNKDFTNLHIENTFYLFVVAGFIAQIIDGSLGMAYGVSSSTLLLNFGISPKIASAAVHTSEVFTTGVSGLMHLRLNNVDKALFKRLVFTGVLGAVIGAYLISKILDGNHIKPFVAAYLLVLGIMILSKGIVNKIKETKEIKRVGLLAFVGGFLDAVGGGGWGPIVTSNLIHQGGAPGKTIGTVNTAEFFVTFFSTGVFLIFVGVQHWDVVMGLIIGGVIAAPIGALIAKKVDKRVLMISVGCLIIITSCFTIYKTLM